MQQVFGFSVPQVEWNPPDISKLPSWAGAKRICFDVETKDPQLQDFNGRKGLGPGNFRPGNHIIGIGFGIEDGPEYYLPIRHEGGDNLDVEKVLQYIRDQAKDYDGEITGANLGYDLGFAEKDQIFFPKVKRFLDVQNAAVIINELHFKYSLDAICEREGIPGKNDTILNQFAAAYGVDPKVEMYKLPGRAADLYGRTDVKLPNILMRRFDRVIENDGLSRVWDMETKILPILVKMRRRGVRINIDKLLKLMSWANSKIDECLKEVHRLSGVQVRRDEIWKASVVARPLLAIGFDVPKTPKGAQFSIKNSVLEKAGEVGKLLARARDYGKIPQFGERRLAYQVNGRLHPVFHQLRNTRENSDESKEESKGARFGRLSGEHPNHQQEFARDDEFGEDWRDIYEPEPDCFWDCSDWSQQEPRIACHYAEKLGLPGAKEFADGYRNDPTVDCHLLMTRIIGWADEKRKIVKNYFNGRIYGMGDAKTCRAIGYPTIWVNRYGKMLEVPGPDGQKIIDRFNEAVPWVKLLCGRAQAQAEKNGCVWTIDGRRCNFPRRPDGTYDWTHKAFSRVGQGSAAGQMKLTLIEADKCGLPIHSVVHDEFNMSTNNMKDVYLLAELQRETVKFSVPMLVDMEIGPSWGKLKKVSKLQKDGNLDSYIRDCIASARPIHA